MYVPALFLLGLLTLQASANSAPSPKDFSIRMFFASCAGDRMDTLSGLYTRSLGTGAEASATIKLTASDLQELFDAVVETRFWDLPATLETRPNADGTVTVTGPSTLYEIEVRRDGISHTVRYDDGVTSTAPDARIQRFKDLVARVLRTFREKPEVRALPAFQVFCA